MAYTIIEWHTGWAHLRSLLDDLVVAETATTHRRASIHAYTHAYNMATQRLPYNWAAMLYSAHLDYLLDVARSPFPSSGLAVYRKASERVSKAMRYVDAYAVRNGLPSLRERAQGNESLLLDQCRAFRAAIRARLAVYHEELIAKVWHPQGALFRYFLVDDEI